MHQECHKQEEELEEASQSYNPEVCYKHRTALCNSYSVLFKHKVCTRPFSSMDSEDSLEIPPFSLVVLALGSFYSHVFCFFTV